MSVLEKSKENNLISNIGKNKRSPVLFRILIVGLGFSAFFTGTTFVPTIANNIGPFEIISFFLILVVFLFFIRDRPKIQFHFTILILTLIVITAITSLPNLVDRISFGVTQLMLLVYTTLLTLILANIIIQFPHLFRSLLRAVALGALLAGTWVLIEGVSSNSPIGTAGPFRNRVHAGIYLLTAFWLVLLYLYWPGVSRGEKIVAISALLVVLYGIAVAGRRSVYLSLFVGLGLLGLSFIVVRGKERFKLSGAVVLALVALIFLAQIGSQYVPQLGFFNDRIGLIDDRLELAAGTGDEIEDSDNFAVLQRQGMIRAVSDHPLLGIGWGGFYESEYSPTGHEMHSTPQRFLAELGIIGFSLYLIFNAYLLIGSVRLFLRARETEYRLPALITSVAIWSLSFSWVYNRNVTERTYWILIILFISLESIVNVEIAKQKNLPLKKKYGKFSYFSKPKRHYTRPIMPSAGSQRSVVDSHTKFQE